MLWADFVVHVKELLQGLALRWHNKANNVHQKLRHRVAIEHDGQDALHRLLLCFIGALLELCPEFLQRWLIRRVVLMYQTVRLIQEGCHDARLTPERVVRAISQSKEATAYDAPPTCILGWEARSWSGSD